MVIHGQTIDIRLEPVNGGYLARIRMQGLDATQERLVDISDTFCRERPTAIIEVITDHLQLWLTDEQHRQGEEVNARA